MVGLQNGVDIFCNHANVSAAKSAWFPHCIGIHFTYTNTHRATRCIHSFDHCFNRIWRNAAFDKDNWNIVVDDEILDQIKVESGEVISLPVLTASEQDIAEVLEFIKEQKSGVRTMNPEKAAQAIVKQREKSNMKSLNFLTKQRCGIGKATLEKIKPYLVFN